ncbi:protein kinase [bacterium]|nr:MAG: protein kinase [bacterium]
MINQTISHYKIIDKVGEGGMGIVYKAQDLNLDRFVALKFLPERLSNSEQDRARFLQEAKAASALNHPNICTIHGIEEHDKQMFIVMELVEGQTLNEKKSSISFKQAIDIGIQLAEGLAVAHEKGIVHRDIKPDNIMIRKDGIAQIMDFGLAKLRGVSRLTKEGSTVGTAGYMSPEQVQGQDADHRSDIFSLGVLLYELFTGQLPFRGVHETALMYEIVNVDPPPMSAVKPDISPELDAIILECMEKDPNERTQSVKQIAIDLKRFKRESSRSRVSMIRPAVTSTIKSPEPNSENRSAMRYIPWAVAGVFLTVILGMLLLKPTTEKGIQTSISSTIIIPDSIRALFFGGGSPPLISPNGQHIAFIDASNSQILVYSLEDRKIIRLPKTEGSIHPFWSPDGKNIGFFQNLKLRKTDLIGGSPVTICISANARGGSWNTNNEIIFTNDYQAPIYLVSANGGDPVPVTTLDSARKEGSHRWPYFLPDGKHFLFLSRTVSESGEAEGDAIYAGSLDGTLKKMIIRSSSNAVYANGHILFIREQTLLAQRFDYEKLTVSGEPFVLETNVINDISWNLAMYSASANGILVSQTGKLVSGAPILVFNKEGKLLQTMGTNDEQRDPRFSPNGKKLGVWLYDLKSRKSNLWTYDLRTGGKTRLTNGKDGEFGPQWSPDGSRVVYYMFGKKGIYEVSVDRTFEVNLFFKSDDFLQTSDWSRDGKYILVRKINAGLNNSDIAWIDSEKRETLQPFLSSQFDEGEARFSPDGKWVSYTSNESGDYELYITSFNSKNGQSWKLSETGAFRPSWGSNSSELFYISNDRSVVQVSWSYANDVVSNVSRKILFTVPLTTVDFDISPDGNNLAFVRAFEAQPLPPISMRLFWYQLQKESK